MARKSTIERVVTEAFTVGENTASLDFLFILLIAGVALNLFFWLLIDSIHFLILSILSGILLYLFAKFRCQFDSALQGVEEKSTKKKKSKKKKVDKKEVEKKPEQKPEEVKKNA